MTASERATEVIAPLVKMAAHGRPVPLGALLDTLHADIAAAITAAVAAEREACAKVVDGWHISKGGYTEMAHQIRSRGESKGESNATK